MQLDIEYMDRNGNIQNKQIQMSMLAFLKHAAIAGQHYEPNITKLPRILGVLLMHSIYLNRYEFYKQNKFSEPDPSFSDPTQKLQFSNLAGKAIADFLVNRIENCFLTVNYEAAMRIYNLPIKGERADLIGFTEKKDQISIEAKGFCKGNISSNDMIKHKQQSKQGGIPFDYSIACVSYNLYKRVKCKYYDPDGLDKSFDESLFRKLTRNYYQGLASFLIPRYSEMTISNEKFLIIRLSDLHYYSNLHNYLHDYLLNLLDKYLLNLLDKYSLILPVNIEELAQKGLKEPLPSLRLDNLDVESKYYISNDRVGILSNET